MRDRDAFRAVGLSTTCSFGNTGAIPGLWQSFNAREGNVQGAVAGMAYVVCCDADETRPFRYVAGVEANGKTEGLDLVELPAGRYVVFTHSGHISVCWPKPER
ncbi:MAG: GyrI-like domain-containing protein [Rhodobacter sp.]|nr:GyrI-like domain-containing protein [Rhodobacter sp.]